ncbi:MAG: SH3 domain-containing protein [Chloroflexota bacterium]|nr:SH3 domain-containing protein [Chloroflexota bacterium]
MRARVLLLVLAFTCLLAVVVPASAQDRPVGSINTGSLNIRSGPGLEYGSIATLPFGFGVPLIARNSEGNWILIQLTNGLTGWVNVNFLFTQYPTRSLPITDYPISSDINPTGRSNAYTLDLRDAPSTENPIIRTVALNTRFQVLGRSYNSVWAQIQLDDGTVGWVESRYIVASVPVRSTVPQDGSVFVPFAPTLPLTPATPQPPQPPTAGVLYHVVRQGETLSTIAAFYGTTIQAIARVNGIVNPDYIYYGTTLIIPV